MNILAAPARGFGGVGVDAVGMRVARGVSGAPAVVTVGVSEVVLSHGYLPFVIAQQFVIAVRFIGKEAPNIFFKNGKFRLYASSSTRPATPRGNRRRDTVGR
jgi:hypothetical protein